MNTAELRAGARTVWVMSPWSSGSSIAFIGTRAFSGLPAGQRYLFAVAARYAAKAGATIVTGAAVGADQAAAEETLRAGDQIRLVLPWPRYEAD